MRKFFTAAVVFCSLLTLPFVAAAQTTTPATAAAPADAYTTFLTEAIHDVLTSGDAVAGQQALNKLGRAAQAQATDWRPRYYQAYGNIRLGFMTENDEQQDKLFDQADANIQQARKLGADESELQVLQAYVYQGRIMVSPMLRGMKFTGMVQESLNKAEKLNPANPRVYLLRGNDLYFRPAMFGGGAEAARPHYERARKVFAAAQPAALAPSWGEQQVLGILKRMDAASVSAQ